MFGSIPQISDVIASSTGSVTPVLGGLAPLYPYLGVGIAITIFGLGVWAIRKATRGGAKVIKGGRSRRGRMRRR